MFIHNRTPHVALQFKSPYYIRYQKEYTFIELHEFEQTCYIKIKVQSKLNSKGKKVHWIGFDDKNSSYRIYNESKILVERMLKILLKLKRRKYNTYKKK